MVYCMKGLVNFLIVYAKNLHGQHEIMLGIYAQLLMGLWYTGLFLRIEKPHCQRNNKAMRFKLISRWSKNN